MKNNNTRATKTRTTKQVARPQRVGGWHVDGWIETGSCRVVIDGDWLGRRYLGAGEDPREFCVFAPAFTSREFASAFEEARSIVRAAIRNHAEMNYEIHQYRATADGAGEWVAAGAGVSPAAEGCVA